MKELVEEKFKEIFGTEGRFKTYFVPAKVNIVGEHTDYKGVAPITLCINNGNLCNNKRKRRQNFKLLLSEF